MLGSTVGAFLGCKHAIDLMKNRGGSILTCIDVRHRGPKHLAGYNAAQGGSHSHHENPPR